MKKALIGITTGLVALGLFLGVTYANDWLFFNGDDQIEQSHNDVDEILNLLQKAVDGKALTEEELATLKVKYDEMLALNPPGLVKQIKSLEEEVRQLKSDNAVLTTDLASANKAYTELQTTHSQATERIDELEYQISQLQADGSHNAEYIAHLEAELTRANEQVQGLGNKTSEALQQAKEITGGE